MRQMIDTEGDLQKRNRNQSHRKTKKKGGHEDDTEKIKERITEEEVEGD